MKLYLQRGFAVLVLAAGFHVLTVWMLPRVMVYGASRRILSEPGSAVNTMLHAPPVNARTQSIVMSSPNLLYSVCVFDLHAAPVRFTADVPETYWSLSFFAANTDNFHVVNQRDVRDGRVDLQLVGPEGPALTAHESEILRAPSNTGIALIRMLIEDRADLARLEATRQSAKCAPWTAIATGQP